MPDAPLPRPLPTAEHVDLFADFDAGEPAVPLSDARNLPECRGRDGKRIDKSTLFRWATRGNLGPDGTRVKLETLKRGGSLVTSRLALRRFFAALSTGCHVPPPAPRSPSRRQRDFERAEAALMSAGI